LPSVLITGAARGIGKSIAMQMAALGWDVIAGVRTEQDGKAITATNPRRITPILLDVTNAEHISALANSLPAKLNAIVNNAGIVVNGPVEAVPPTEVRRQFEVNVIGQLAVTQAVLPRLRRSRGRIVFLSSIAGKVSYPLHGVYSASKFAIEALADALRIELRPWKIAVSVVQPAQVDTEMSSAAGGLVDEMTAVISPEHRSLYARHLEGLAQSIPGAERLVLPADRVAEVVAQALTTRRPRARYVVGLNARMQLAVLPNLPTAVRDRLFHTLARQPR
jgi:NAD(P)-dependent dehydrogenase (short-subunit alcohol dehydrogenase family)